MTYAPASVAGRPEVSLHWHRCDSVGAYTRPDLNLTGAAVQDVSARVSLEVGDVVRSWCSG